MSVRDQDLPTDDHIGSTIPVGVIGSAIDAPFEDSAKSLEEILYDVTLAAVSDADLSMEDIDGIVVSANDQLDGRAISIMAASGSVGGVGRDILSAPSSAEHAFVLGKLRVASGEFRTQLVVAWNSTEAENVSEVQRLAADPYFHRALPLDEWSAFALQATALENFSPSVASSAIAVVAKNRCHGVLAQPHHVLAPMEPAEIESSPVFRWPIRRDMVAPPTNGVVALVLASQMFIEQKRDSRIAWIQGLGWATESALLGDRDLARLPSLRVAAGQAYREAGITDPRSTITLAEVTDTTPYLELLAWEGLGFCDRSEWAAFSSQNYFSREGSLPINVSGGSITINATFCSSLIRVAEAANQVRGCAGPHQLPGSHLAVAHAASGFSAQYNTVVVLGREPRGILS